jgi:hypothetical protein
MNFCKVVMPLLSGAFGGLLALAMMGAGLAKVGAPESAKRLLKNLAIALGLFALGTWVLHCLCAVGR